MTFLVRPSSVSSFRFTRALCGEEKATRRAGAKTVRGKPDFSAWGDGVLHFNLSPKGSKVEFLNEMNTPPAGLCCNNYKSGNKKSYFIRHVAPGRRFNNDAAF